MDIKARLFRNHPLGDVASHAIGYIGRINQTEKARIQDSEDEANYRGTEYIGKLGIEHSFESACMAPRVWSRWKPRRVAVPCASSPATPVTPATA